MINSGFHKNNIKSDSNISYLEASFKEIKSRLESIIFMDSSNIISDGNIQISNWSQSDVHLLLSIADDSSIAENFIGFPFPYTEKDARNWIHQHTEGAGETSFSFKILLEGVLAGSITYDLKQGEPNTAIISYWVGKDFRGKGIGKSAVRSFMKYLFDMTDVVNIEAHVLNGNVHSESILADNFFHLQSENIDVLDSEGEKKKESIFAISKENYDRYIYIVNNFDAIKTTFVNYEDFINDYIGNITVNGTYKLFFQDSDDFLTLRKKTVEVGDIDIVAEIFIDEDYKIENNLSADSCVIDIGGQIGCFSVYAARKLKNANIYSFEPLKENFDILNDNSKCYSSITAINKGISSANGESKIFISPDNVGAHSMIENDSGLDYQEISTISLERVFSNFDISSVDLVKIDCEGMEYDILYNTPIDILQRIKSIYMEVHFNDEIAKDHEKYDMVTFLTKNGFSVKILKEFYYEGEGEFYVIQAFRE